METPTKVSNTITNTNPDGCPCIVCNKHPSWVVGTYVEAIHFNLMVIRDALEREEPLPVLKAIAKHS